jgi:hypothetical protein
MDLVEVYDNGTGGANEVAHWVDVSNRWANKGDENIVLKVMVISRPKVHQRRKALTEAVFWELDNGLGGETVSNPVEVGMWRKGLFPYHEEVFGNENSEGWQRMCWVKRGFSPGVPGDEWRGSLLRTHGNLADADAMAKRVIDTHPDAARIALLDILTGNQDRSARNWCTNLGQRFFAIDNGMAWFHEYWSRGEQNNYPEYGWQQGFVIDDVLIQTGEWRFISGVFSTSWAGKPIPEPLLTGMRAFDAVVWVEKVAHACRLLGYPTEVATDWRFEAILKRMSWMAEKGRFPGANEYRFWRQAGSELLTPPEVIAAGGREIWNIKMDYEYLNEAAYKKLSGGPERPK